MQKLPSENEERYVFDTLDEGIKFIVETLTKAILKQKDIKSCFNKDMKLSINNDAVFINAQNRHILIKDSEKDCTAIYMGANGLTEDLLVVVDKKGKTTFYEFKTDQITDTDDFNKSKTMKDLMDILIKDYHKVVSADDTTFNKETKTQLLLSVSESTDYAELFAFNDSFFKEPLIEFAK